MKVNIPVDIEVVREVLREAERNGPPWYTIAHGEMGVSELPGHDHNARILEYHAQTSLKATTDEIPWCASFVSWCLECAGIPSTRSAAARSYDKWGVKLDEPKLGAVVCMWRGEKNSRSGHVGFYVRHSTSKSGHIYVLGGNQSNKVCIDLYPEERVLSYRWPEQEI